MSGPATIQPHGFLVELSPGWRVRAASANLGQFLGTSAEAALGLGLDQLVGGEAVHALRNRLALLRDPGGEAHLLRYSLATGAPPLDLAMRLTSGGGVTLEARPNSEREPPDIVGTVRGAIARLPVSGTIGQLVDEGIRQLRAMTGFDAVSAYQHPGLLVASSARGSSPLADGAAPGAEPRLVCDGEAAPVAIVGELAGAPGASLRSPDNDERDALRRSGAQALLALPLFNGDSPWGVIACRHHLPRLMTLERQSGAELFVEMLSLRIGNAGRDR